MASTTDHQKGEKLIGSLEAWIRPTGMTVDDRKELASIYKQFVFLFKPFPAIQAGEADIPASALKIQHCQLSDMPDTLVHTNRG